MTWFSRSVFTSSWLMATEMLMMITRPWVIRPSPAEYSRPIRTLLAHRTFRAYTAEPVSREAIETILTVALHGATSSFQQQVTVIRVQDPAVHEQVHLASGQPYVGGERGELFVFVVDLHRNAVLRERAGADLEPLERTSLFLQGVEDTMIAAQNAVVAASPPGLDPRGTASAHRDGG